MTTVDRAPQAGDWLTIGGVLFALIRVSPVTRTVQVRRVGDYGTTEMELDRLLALPFDAELKRWGTP